MNSISKDIYPEGLEAIRTLTYLLGAVIPYFIFKVLSLMQHGIDLTDEGYYLNWISNPWLYQFYVSQFGYIYHPIYQLLGSDLVLLRGFNALFTYALGLMLSYLIIKRLSSHQSKSLILVISAGIALSSLMIMMITGHWLPSPSYNSLCFQGLLITVTGLVLTDGNHNNSRLIAGGIVGLGGWLVFMAKPTSALLLCVVVPLYFATELKKYWRVLLGASLVAIGLLLLSAFYIDGSIMQFIKRYQMGMTLLDSMGSKHGVENLFRLDLFKVSIVDQYKFLIISVLLTGLFLSVRRASSKLKVIAITLLLITLCVMLWNAFSNSGIKISTPRYHPLILLALLFAAIAFWGFCKGTNQPSKIPGKLILVLLILPYVYAAGSGNNYWETAAGAMLFWMLASLIILNRTMPNQTHIAVFALIVASLTIKVLLDSQNSPYRQTEAIAYQSSKFINPHTQKELLLSKDTKTYLSDLSHLLQKTGFKKHTPVIDFTGHHPGTLYFMQAKAIGQAWAIGGYDGSNTMATLALNQATCHEIANAWLIIEKDGRRSIDVGILEQHGIQANKSHYKKVGMILTKTLTDPGFVSKSHLDGRYEQYFLKPSQPKSQEERCLAYRQQGLAPQL